jgi:hypothetical protein
MAGGRRVVAFGLTLVGAVLVLVDGAFIAEVGSVLSSSGFGPAGPAVTDVGALGFIFGSILLLLAFGLLFTRRDRARISGAILIFSAASFFGGGGFILGMFLGFGGGIAGLFPAGDANEDEAIDVDLDGELSVRPRRASTSSRCPTCHAIVYSDEMACLRCGAGLPENPAAAV